jgi:hypothetical protein
MKTYVANFSTLCVLIIICLFGCKKDKENEITSEFNHRIVSEKMYTNIDQLDYETTYEYSGNRLSRILAYDEKVEFSFQYPDNNTITFNYTEDIESIYEGSGIISLTNNMVSEIVFDNETKAVYNYNSDGEIAAIKYYDFDGSWILYEEDVFTYSSGKLIQIKSSYPYEVPVSEYKYVYSYNGEELKESIYSHREGENPWIEESKSAYSYNFGKISKITFFYNNETTWLEEGFEEYTYDANGNLIEIYNSKYAERTVYTYEEGSGNYRQIFDFAIEPVDFEIDYKPNLEPIPN